MRFRPAQRFSRRGPPVGRILLLAASLFFCFISGAGSVTAQTTDDHGNTLDTATPLSPGKGSHPAWSPVSDAVCWL
jgi:hypothetical protein